MKNASSTRPKQPVEMVDDTMASVLAGMTEAERLEIGFGLWRSAQRLVAAAVRDQHPSFTDEEASREVAARMSHGLTRSLGIASESLRRT